MNSVNASAVEFTAYCEREDRSAFDSDSNRECLWKETGLAKVVPGARGAKILFSFDLPDGLPRSKILLGRIADVRWGLCLRAKDSSFSVRREYLIPVYPLDANKARVQRDVQRSDLDALALENAKLKVSECYEVEPGSRILCFRPFNMKLRSLMLTVAGSVGSSVCFTLAVQWGIYFSALPLLCIAASIRWRLSKTRLSRAGDFLRVAQPRLGGPARIVELDSTQLEHFELMLQMTTKSQGRATRRYGLFVRDHEGQRHCIGGHPRSEADGRAAIVYLRDYLGLAVPKEATLKVDAREYIA